MRASKNYVFNFAVSYSGGGYKRLFEYLKKFNTTGGALFILHPSCRGLAEEFGNNSYFFADQSKYERLLNDCGYLSEISDLKGVPDLYYSYGIPIYSRVARVNWFHLSNVLPLSPSNIPMSPFDHIKMRLLRRRIINNLNNADVISAESNYSLGLFGHKEKDKLFLSVNGGDDELAIMGSDRAQTKESIAVVVGTYRYKSIVDSFRVFEMLKRTTCPYLKLVIIGVVEQIPKDIASNPNVVVKGLLSRSEVMACLKVARYYISTTYIENSYNAASEGVFIADESYISDIGPHRELLLDMPFELVAIPGVNRSVLRIKRKDMNGSNLVPWETVITDMLTKVQSMLPDASAATRSTSSRIVSA